MKLRFRVFKLELSQIFIILFLSLIQLSCSTSPREQEHLDHEKLADDLKQEKEVGREMASKLAGLLGYVGNLPNLTLYVNLVGQSVASHSSRPEISYHFGILKDPEVNAFATPGGYIFVTLGLLRTLQSEAELAGILGHEIAHVTEKHMYNEITPKREVSAGETVTRLLSRGGSNIGYSMSKIVNAGLDILLEKGLGQEKENEADQVGTTFASSDGYDSWALQHYLVRLSKSTTSVKVSKTHPPFPERLKSLTAFLEKNGFKPGMTQVRGDVLKKRFAKYMADIPSK